MSTQRKELARAARDESYRRRVGKAVDDALERARAEELRVLDLTRDRYRSCPAARRPVPA